MSLTCFPNNLDHLRFCICETIAFQPSKGFMITEGYYHLRLKEIDFPVNITIYQDIKDNIGKHNKYELKVNKISRKYLPIQIENLDYDSEAGGYISYFQKYIMITYFDIVDFNYNDPNSQIHTEFNTDSRFKTAEELLEAYEKLDEYNDDTYEDVSEETKEFFKDYFKFEKL